MANICSHCSHSPLSDKSTAPAIGTRAPSNRPTNQTEQVQMFAKWQRNSGPKQQPEPQTCRSTGKGVPAKLPTLHSRLGTECRHHCSIELT